MNNTDKITFNGMIIMSIVSFIFFVIFSINKGIVYASPLLIIFSLSISICYITLQFDKV